MNAAVGIEGLVLGWYSTRRSITWVRPSVPLIPFRGPASGFWEIPRTRR